MAPINPVIAPVQGENYFKFSDDIRPGTNIQPQGVAETSIKPKGNLVTDTSGELAGKAMAGLISGVGGLLDFGGKVAETIQQDDIRKKITRRYDSEKEREIATLEDIQTSLNQPTTLRRDIGTGQVPIGTTTDPDTLPTAVNEVLPRRMNTLASALQDGKVSHLEFRARAFDIAKEFRQQYPGQREFIDKTVSNALHEPSANQYVQELSTSINHSMAAIKSEQEKVMTFAKSHIGVDNMDQYIAGYQAGLIPAQAIYNAVHMHENFKSKLQMAKMVREDNKDRIAEVTDGDKRNLDVLGAESMERDIFNMTTPLGWGGYADNKKIMDVIEGVRSGKLKPPSDEEAQQLATVINQQKQVSITRLKKIAREQGWYESVGSEEVDKKINALSSSFDGMSKLITDRDYGWANHFANRAKARQGDVNFQLAGSDIGTEMGILAAVKQKGGEAAAGQVMTKLMGDGFSRKLDTLIANGKMNIINQTGVEVDGRIKTLRQEVDKMEKTGQKDPRVYNQFMDLIDVVSGKEDSDQIRMNVASGIFSQGFLDKNWVDRNGKDARYTIFNRMTTEKVRDSMYELGKKDPKVWGLYTDWVQNQFGKVLFTKEIQTLKEVPEIYGMGIRWHSEPETDGYQWRLTYRGEDITFKKLQLGSGASLVSNLPGGLQYYQGMINRLNSALPAVAGISSKSGLDVEAYILNLFKDLDFDPTKGNVQGVPKQMIDAVIAARKKQEERNK